MAGTPSLPAEGGAHDDYDQLVEIEGDEEEEEGADELSDSDSASVSESESDDDGAHSMLATHNSPWNIPPCLRRRVER
jgi:hypothetical protein